MKVILFARPSSIFELFPSFPPSFLPLCHFWWCPNCVSMHWRSSDSSWFPSAAVPPSRRISPRQHWSQSFEKQSSRDLPSSIQLISTCCLPQYSSHIIISILYLQSCPLICPRSASLRILSFSQSVSEDSPHHVRSSSLSFIDRLLRPRPVHVSIRSRAEYVFHHSDTLLCQGVSLLRQICASLDQAFVFFLCSFHVLSRILRCSCICSPARHIPPHVRELRSSLLLRSPSACPLLRRRWIITNDSDFVSNTVPVLSSYFPSPYYVYSQFRNCLSMICWKTGSPCLLPPRTNFPLPEYSIFPQRFPAWFPWNTWNPCRRIWSSSPPSDPSYPCAVPRKSSMYPHIQESILTLPHERLSWRPRSPTISKCPWDL